MTDQTSTELTAAGVPQDALARLAELQPGKPGAILLTALQAADRMVKGVCRCPWFPAK